MITNDQVTTFQNLLSQAESITVIYPSQASEDVIFAASALATSLQDSGKRVTLATPQQPQVKTEGVLQPVTDIGNQHLTVSFDYSEQAVDKVSYHIGEDNKKFYLTIKPQAGQPPLDASSVEFNYSGFETDLIILIGVSSVDDLDQLYDGYEDIYDATPLVTLRSNTGRTAAVDLSVDNGASISQTIASTLVDSQLPINDQVATLLLHGIEEATDYFSSFSATAETFEMVAELMRAGARRSKRPQAQPTITQANPVQHPQPQKKQTDVVTVSPHRQNKHSDKRQNPKQNKPGGLNYQPSEGGQKSS